MKNENTWKVYIHTVPKEISGHDIDKKYVGITKKSPEHRWENGYGYRQNTHFFRAIEKYGWKNLKHEVVAENLSHNDACDLERMLIFLNDTTNPQRGYNKTLGGDGTLGHKHSEEEKARRSERYMGENNPYYGKKHTPEIRAKMVKNHTDVSGSKHPKARKVYQFSLDNEFIKRYDYIKEAANNCNATDMSIHRAARTGYVCMGYFWGFEEDVIKKNNTYFLKEKHHIHTTEKEVYQFSSDGNFVKKYKSVCEAGKETHLHKQNIGGVARGVKKTSGGYIWKYEEDVVSVDNTYMIKER